MATRVLRLGSWAHRVGDERGRGQSSAPMIVSRTRQRREGGLYVDPREDTGI